MGKAISKSGFGSGWHKQSGRHSNARKLGKAGGKYATDKLKKIGKHIKTVSTSTIPPYKKTLMKGEKIGKKGLELIKLSKDSQNKVLNDKLNALERNIEEANKIGDYHSAEFYEKLYDKLIKKDSDRDGVPDYKDCEPMNPKMQGEEHLQAIHDSAQSFYGKAKVELKEGRTVLTSYATEVAEIKDGKAKVFGTYSQTTLRHIKEFLKQNGFKAEDKKQIEKDYMDE